MIKVALFGAGFIGKIHGTNIVKHPQAQLKLIYDVNRGAAEELATRLGAKVAENPEQIWASDVDAVLIASSTNTHAELLLDAIAVNKAIYCEKPIDLDIERVKAVAQAAHGYDKPILVGFSRRYDDNHLGVKEALQNGKLGKLEMMHLTCRDTAPPPISYVKVSGGQLRDQTIHFFDMLRWLANEDPVEVYAMGAALVDPAIGEAGDIDTSMVTLKLPSGALCHIDSSRRTAYGYDERVELFGSEGMAISRRKPKRDITMFTVDKKIVGDGLQAGWFERMFPTFYIALDAFICAVQGEEVAYPTLLDGLKAQLVAEAAVESLKTNRPVKVTYWEPK